MATPSLVKLWTTAKTKAAKERGSKTKPGGASGIEKRISAIDKLLKTKKADPEAVLKDVARLRMDMADYMVELGDDPLAKGLKKVLDTLGALETGLSDVARQKDEMGRAVAGYWAEYTRLNTLFNNLCARIDKGHAKMDELRKANDWDKFFAVATKVAKLDADVQKLGRDRDAVFGKLMQLDNRT